MNSHLSSLNSGGKRRLFSGRVVFFVTTLLLTGAFLSGVHRLQAADDAAGIEFFETKIRPVLADKCYGCHSSEAEGRKKLKADLYLDSKAGMLKGGKEGPVLVPGDLEKSKLIESIRYTNDDTAMPPKEKLPDSAIADIEAWVKMGAPDPRVGDKAPKRGAALVAQAKQHWAFQPIVAGAIPEVKSPNWAQTEIDRFVLAKLEAAKLTPAAPAQKRALLRRATYDLTGLPPTANEVKAFEEDAAPDAFSKIVERLLASPAYGERWGRHWLDVARYADTKGYVFQEDRAYPYAYTYRDWVVQSFNGDLPYDRFLQLQIAGDRLAGENKKDLAALGFLTVGRRFINNIHDIIDDRLDLLGRGTMGVTIACARCHDHKFDPISTKDYYSLYGVFASSEEPKDLPVIAEAKDPKETAAYNLEHAKREKAVEDFRTTRFNEGIKLMRSAEKIANYLSAVHESDAKKGAEIASIAAHRKIEAPLLNRWRAWMAKIDGKHPVLGPWKILSGVEAGEFEVKAQALYDLYGSQETAALNPLVAERLAEQKPSTVDELSKVYGELIASNDAEAPHEDLNKEALRQVLRGEGTPTVVPYDKANDVLNRADEDKVRELQKKVDELANEHPGAPARAMVMEDRPQPRNVKVFLRGQPGNNGEDAPRKFLTFFEEKDAKPFSEGSGRVELARAVTNKENPLTARVFVNRIWGWHFGSGLVRTPSDFGLRTEAPVHRELLDWLAARFIADGWSVKKMHRLIMASAVYQQAAEVSPEAKQSDADNALWSHFNRQRLDYEAMRDSMLAVSEQLDRATGGKAIDFEKESQSGRRTLYGVIDRQNLPGMFRSFDFASPDTHTPQRFFTTVPQQALYFMNSPFVAKQARAVSKCTEGITAPAKRVNALYQRVLTRGAGAGEVQKGVAFIQALETTAAEPEPAPIWVHGNGQFDPEKRTLNGFVPLPHFTGKSWQGGEKLPDPKLGYSSLNAEGGHPGGGHNLTVVRRFTAPLDGTYRFMGTLSRGSKAGDGVRGLAIVNQTQVLGDWTVLSGESATAVENVALKAGQTLDFVLDCIGNENSDGFRWAPIVTRAEGGEWSVAASFKEHGVPKIEPLSPWERYAQALLMTNEFVFVD